MWFKKKAYISGYNSNTAVDGIDWRTNGNSNTWPASQTLPSAADANKYFYLPALSRYNDGGLYSVGYDGWYWSSSSIPFNSWNAYYLYFNSGNVTVDYRSSTNGFRAEALFE